MNRIRLEKMQLYLSEQSWRRTSHYTLQRARKESCKCFAERIDNNYTEKNRQKSPTMFDFTFTVNVHVCKSYTVQ